MIDCTSTNYAYGRLLQCQLPKGHGGNHVFSITWTDKKESEK